MTNQWGYIVPFYGESMINYPPLNPARSLRNLRKSARSDWLVQRKIRPMLNKGVPLVTMIALCKNININQYHTYITFSKLYLN